MADADGRFRCDCEKYCKEKKAVSRSTYFAHAKYRKSNIADFNAFRAAHSQNQGNQPGPLNQQPQFQGQGSFAQNPVSN